MAITDVWYVTSFIESDGESDVIALIVSSSVRPTVSEPVNLSHTSVSRRSGRRKPVLTKLCKFPLSSQPAASLTPGKIVYSSTRDQAPVRSQDEEFRPEAEQR